MLLVEMFKETVTLNFVIKKKKTIIYISVVYMGFDTRTWDSKWHMKILARIGPSGDPIDTPSVWSKSGIIQ